MAKKYIDADRLRAEIKIIQKSLGQRDVRFNQIKQIRTDCMIEFCKMLNNVIDSLQQEPPINTELCTLIACDVIQATAKRAIEKPQDKDKEEDLMIKKMEYLNMLEKSFFQQEQPEVDLEKELEEEIARYLREECSADDEPSVSEIARHFAEWGAKHKNQ